MSDCLFVFDSLRWLARGTYQRRRRRCRQLRWWLLLFWWYIITNTQSSQKTYHFHFSERSVISVLLLLLPLSSDGLCRTSGPKRWSSWESEGGCVYLGQSVRQLPFCQIHMWVVCKYSVGLVAQVNAVHLRPSCFVSVCLRDKQKVSRGSGGSNLLRGSAKSTWRPHQQLGYSNNSIGQPMESGPIKHKPHVSTTNWLGSAVVEWRA